MSCNKCKEQIQAAMPNCPECTGAPTSGHGGCPDCGCGDCCGCPTPIQSIEQMDSQNPGMLRFNYGGHSVYYDFTNMIQQVQTDTSLRVNVLNRTLNYHAERHEDVLAGKELGAVLHLGDLGDVDASGLSDGSMLVYHKDADCGQGCQGINNSWRAWSALTSQADSLKYGMGFDANGQPHSLGTPITPSQHYLLAWRANGQLGYTQPAQFASFPKDSDNNAYVLCMDPTTKQIGYVKVKRGNTVTIS